MNFGAAVGKLLHSTCGNFMHPTHKFREILVWDLVQEQLEPTKQRITRGVLQWRRSMHIVEVPNFKIHGPENCLFC